MKIALPYIPRFFLFIAGASLKAASMAAALTSKLKRAVRGTPRRCVFYDLETSYTGPWKQGMFKGKKGASRRNLIVEIGAVSLPDRLIFHRLVDPRLKHMDVKTTLETTGQDIGRTLKSWAKLFSEKNLIPKHSAAWRAQSTEERMRAFDRLFSDRKIFVSTRSAVAHFTKFVYNGSVTCPLIIAHSGCRFDHNVLRHTMLRLKLPQLDSKKMVDSIPVARRCAPGLKSYALGALHRHLFSADFEMAHHAMADVHATVRVITHLAQREQIPVHALWDSARSKNAPLVSLRGVGPKTAAALRDAGYDMATLRAAVLQFTECPQSIATRVRNHKALWKNLRKQLQPAKLSDKDGADLAQTQTRTTRQNKCRQLARAQHRFRSKSV